MLGHVSADLRVKSCKKMCHFAGMTIAGYSCVCNVDLSLLRDNNSYNIQLYNYILYTCNYIQYIFIRNLCMYVCGCVNIHPHSTAQQLCSAATTS